MPQPQANLGVWISSGPYSGDMICPADVNREQALTIAGRAERLVRAAVFVGTLQDARNHGGLKNIQGYPL